MNSHSLSILLDAEALSAAADTRRVIHPWLEFARQSDSILYVSAITLAEVSNGTGLDVKVRRMVNSVRVLPVTDAIGYTAGRLRHAAANARRKARDLTIDAVVAATAITLPGNAVVVTSDPRDLSLLLQGTEVRVEGLTS